MLKAIDRIGLISAGAVCGALAAALTVILGILGFAAAAAMGEAALAGLAARMLEEDGLGPATAASLLAVSWVVLLAIATAAALVGGFLAGAFLAALYNVTAGITGGIRVSLRDP